MNRKQFDIYKVWRAKKYKRDLEKKRDELADRGMSQSGFREKEEQWLSDEFNADLIRAENEAIEFEDEKADRKKNSRVQNIVNIVLAVTALIALFFSAKQNDINDRLLDLEEASREPILQVYFDKVSLDKEQNFVAQLHFHNVGSVPIYNIKYGAGDFNAAISRATSAPMTMFNVIHHFSIGMPGIIPPGKEVVMPIVIKELKIYGVYESLKEIPAIPTVWVGAMYSRYPNGATKCVELDFMPLPEYQKYPNLSQECGPWWPDFENHLQY